MAVRPTFYEFFAGAGMARAGLGPGWTPTFANDLDPMKVAAYALNGDAAHMTAGDVWDLSTADLPGHADLAWASSPCQDLSLAGKRGGLSEERSGAFWGFHRLMEGLAAEGRAPRILVLENVTGLLTSRGGGDFASVVGALVDLGYAWGALEVDAAHWTPQSRPRLFVIASQMPLPSGLSSSAPSPPFHSRRLIAAVNQLPADLADTVVWWNFRAPAPRNTSLVDVLESDTDVLWHSKDKTDRFVEQFSLLHASRLERGSGRRIGTIYRRMRDESGHRVQRAELRIDGLAGCLRTPAGGSSRQFILISENGVVRTRPLTPREAARLMGLPDSWRLPTATTSALKTLGDGVVVPVVTAIRDQLLCEISRAEND